MKRLPLPLVGALSLVLLGGASAAPTGTTKGKKVSRPAAPVRSKPDAALYEEARRARATLEGSPRLMAQRAVWDKVIGRYRLVVARYPRSGYSDDALLAVGDLSRAMARRFKKPALLDDAQRAYETLADEYPSSRHAEPALFAVFEIAQAGSDKNRLLEAGRGYVDAFPDAARARTVKAALQRRAPEKAAAFPSPPPPGLTSVYDLRVWTGDAATRVVVDLERKVAIDSDRISNPDRLWVDLKGARLHPKLARREFGVYNGLLEKVRVAPNREGVVRIVLDFREVDGYNLFYLENPLRLVVDVKGTMPKAMAAASPADKPAAEAKVAQATPASRPRPVVETVPDADDDVRADDPLAPPLPTATPRPAAPPPARHEVPETRLPAIAAASPAPSPAAASTPGPALQRLPARRVNAQAEDETPAPKSRPTPPPVHLESPRTTTAPSTPTTLPQPSQANRAGSYSIARQLGLGARRIVIDAGHGGHDPGTIGSRGLMEKDLVLDVALRLEKMVRQELGADVILTRGSDVFVPLEERTAIANSRGADLFLSIHANASRNSRARGIETYFLSFARDPHAEEVAARENAISAATMKDLQGLVKAIALNSKIDESRDFATSVQEAMVRTVRGRYPVQDRGVHTAPFYVLIGANMPSVLAEIAFVSNPEDEKHLKTPGYRDTVARSLLSGVRSYLESLARPPARALTAAPRRSTVAEGSR